MPLAKDTTEPTLPHECGGFRLLEELGRGGMGVVYRAQETASGRVVALKVLARELAVSTEAFQRFQREARVAAAISDRNCVFVFGAHELDGAPAIAMELCTGETLQERLQRGVPIPIADAVRWTIQILEGLEAANEAGILHRDVKPSNCFLTDSGDVKVGDFGLSKVLETDIGLTRSGAFLGSPLYASPEQARGRDLDLRSDLYSVGATLYALLGGRAPYSGTSVGEVLARILSEDPDPMRTLRPDVPRGLEKVVLKAMSRKPEERFKDHEAFIRALEPFRDAVVEAAGPIRRTSAWLIDLILSASVSTSMMALGSALGIQVMRFDPERPYLMESWWLQALLGLPSILYPGLCEGLWGATLGKWLIGVRVVAVDDLQPSFWRALLRAFLIYGTAPAIILPIHFTDIGVGQEPGGPVQIVVGVLPLVVTLVMLSIARPRNGWQGLHGRLSGTRAILSPSPLLRHAPARELGEARTSEAPDVPATVGRITILGALSKTPGGRLLVGRDEDLARSVWLHAVAPDAAPVGERRRSVSRPARLRWLSVATLDGLRFEIYEAPGGVALADGVARGGTPDWPTVRRWLLGLADELAHEENAGERYAQEQLWIDRGWGLRVLDTPAAPGARATLGPLELLAAAARLAVPRDAGGAVRLPADLPIHAEPALKRLVGLDAPFSGLDEALGALAEWKDKPAVPVPRMRVAQIALSTVLPIFVAISGLFGALMMSIVLGEVGEGLIAGQELVHDQRRAASLQAQAEEERTSMIDAGDTDTEATAEPRRNREPLSEESRHARRVVVRDALERSWAPVFQQQDEELRALVREVRAELGPPTPEELERAIEHIEREERPGGDPRDFMKRLPVWVALGGPCLAALLWGVLASITTLIVGTGLSFRISGLRLRTSRGRRASRLRTIARSAVTWAPFCLVFGAALTLSIMGQPVLAVVLGVLGALGFVVGLAYTALPGRRSLQDRAARTHVVPL